jgi:hypothetical protein
MKIFLAMLFVVFGASALDYLHKAIYGQHPRIVEHSIQSDALKSYIHGLIALVSILLVIFA